MKPGTLLLLPNVLGDVKHHAPYLPQSVDKAVLSLDGLIAESDRGGRRYLGRFMEVDRARAIPLALIENKPTPSDIQFFLEPLLKGETWGIVSDAGLPSVADPGALLVSRAREVGIAIKAFIGPSAVTLALMLSGFPGQRFAFHGYLPKDEEGKKLSIQRLEARACEEQSTEIFIEAPHRNRFTLEQVLETLKPSTSLCVAWDLTLPGQNVMVQSVERWKKAPLPNIDKKPAVFLIGPPG